MIIFRRRLSVPCAFLPFFGLSRCVADSSSIVIVRCVNGSFCPRARCSLFFLSLRRLSFQRSAPPLRRSTARGRPAASVLALWASPAAQGIHSILKPFSSPSALSSLGRLLSRCDRLSLVHPASGRLSTPLGSNSNSPSARVLLSSLLLPRTRHCAVMLISEVNSLLNFASRSFRLRWEGTWKLEDWLLLVEEQADRTAQETIERESSGGRVSVAGDPTWGKNHVRGSNRECRSFGLRALTSIREPSISTISRSVPSRTSERRRGNPAINRRSTQHGSNLFNSISPAAPPSWKRPTIPPDGRTRLSKRSKWR